MIVISKMTVYFEGQFWVGVYQRKTEKELEAAKIIFGAEPKDYDVYSYILKNWHKIRFSNAILIDHKHLPGKINPKRMQRTISKQIAAPKPVSTKAQEALKFEHEKKALERKSSQKLKSEIEKERKFELRQSKKKEKHKGR